MRPSSAMALAFIRSASVLAAVPAARSRSTFDALRDHLPTQRYRGSPRADEAELVDRMTELALQYGRYGYRKIARFLRDEGFAASPKRVERSWRGEGLKVPKR